MASMPAVVDGKGREHCKRRQQARLRRHVVDEKAQQHRPYCLFTYLYILGEWYIEVVFQAAFLATSGQWPNTPRSINITI